MAARFVHKAYLAKAPSTVQSEFAKWIEKTTGHVVPEGDVALVQRLYPLYLKTPEVVKARDAATTSREKEKAAREKRVKEQKQARLVALEQTRHRLMQDLGIEPEGEVPNLAVVPDAEPDPEDGDETTDGATGLVLGAPSDEFVEVTPAEDEPETVEPDADGDPTDDDGGDWDEDTDDGEDDF